jgi:hypothetical protein
VEVAVDVDVERVVPGLDGEVVDRVAVLLDCGVVHQSGQAL